eukprot:2767298-Amphidinium_carterae.1
MQLSVFNVQINGLAGELPEDGLSGLTMLRAFGLGRNPLTGTLPEPRSKSKNSVQCPVVRCL